MSRAIRSYLIVLLTPSFNQCLYLRECLKYLCVKLFVVTWPSFWFTNLKFSLMFSEFPYLRLPPYPGRLLFLFDLLLCQVYITRTLHHLRDGGIVFRAPKTAKGRRMVALSPSAVSVLREHKEKQKLDRVMLGIPLKDDDLVFSDLEGKPLLPDTVTHAWIKLVRRTGLKGIRLHDARHSHASLMLKAGTHPKIVQERLGHSSITITLDTYSHIAPGLQESAAESFDKLLNGRREKEAVENHY